MKKNVFLISIMLIILIIFSNNVYANDGNIEIETPSAILIDANTGKVLYEKDSERKMYPASVTKVMTALLVLENVQDLNKKTTVSYENVFTVPVGYSVDTLKVGEEFTIEELLYALLVSSSNEAAFTLADFVAGGTQSFATMMNTKAKELGCTSTNFVNPNGIHNENHYTTAKDMSIISREAMKNETFRKMVKTVNYTLPATNKYDKNDRILTNTNDLINKKSKNYYENSIGIKTGYTSFAKNCLVSGAKKDGVELIAVLLGADKEDNNGYSIRDKDSKILFEYAYNNYINKEISKANETIVAETKIKNATRDTRNLKLTTDKDINILIPKEKENKNIDSEIKLKEDLQAPIAKGTIIGTISYTEDNIKYEANLVATEDVLKANWILNILGIALAIVILIIIYIIFEKSRRKRKKYQYIRNIY